MKISVLIKSIFRKTEFLSAPFLLQRAELIAVVFLVAHLAGLREYTSILNGTMGSVALGWKLSAFLGVSYVVLYLAFVVLVPILVLAAAILWIWEYFQSQVPTEPSNYASRENPAPPH